MQLYASEGDLPTLVSTYEVSPESMSEDLITILNTHNQLTTQTQYFFVTCSLNCSIELLEQVRLHFVSYHL